MFESIAAGQQKFRNQEKFITIILPTHQCNAHQNNNFDASKLGKSSDGVIKLKLYFTNSPALDIASKRPSLKIGTAITQHSSKKIKITLEIAKSL